MPALKHAAAMRREFTAAQCIPYRAHVAPTVIRTEFGDYLQAFRLGGAAFETADDAELNNWHERLNVCWRNVASPGVALWTHVIRRRASFQELESRDPAGSALGRFATDLCSRYYSRLREETLMINELYLSVLYRPIAGKATGLLSRAFAKARRDSPRAELADALDACEKLSQTLVASLARYEPEPLACYREGRLWCSSLLEYLALLINGEPSRLFLPRGPLDRCLGIGSPGHQGISHAHRRRHVRPSIVRTDIVRTHAIICVSEQDQRTGAPATPIQPDGQRGRLCCLAGR